MTRILVLLVLALPGTGARAGTQRPADTTTAQYQTSGLAVIHRTVPGSDLVAVRLYLLGGARQLSAKSAGIEALLLRAAALDALGAIAPTGASTTLESDLDWTVAGFVVLKEDLEEAWTGFARWIVEPALSAEALTDVAIGRARDELLSAARRRYAHPDLRLQMLAEHVLFAGHPYGLDPEGTVESLAALGRADLERYARAHTVTSRMLLVLVGDVQRARVDSLVGATFGRLSPGDYRWTLPAPVTHRSNRVRFEHRFLPTNYIVGYFTGPTPQDRDYAAFWVATQLLSSKLFRAVRVQRSLSYAAHGRFLDRAIPAGGVYASSSDPAEVYKLMRRELVALQSEPIDRWSLARFLDQFTIDELAQHMTTEGQAEALGRAYLLFGDYRVAGQLLSRLRRVTPELIQRTAARYIPHIQWAYLGDTTLMRGKW